MILKTPHLLTELLILRPKYSTQYTEVGEPVALLSKRKVDFATGIIRVKFTKAPHLKGQRFCIMKQDVQRQPISTNGAIAVYEVPMSDFDSYETIAEIEETIESFGW